MKRLANVIVRLLLASGFTSACIACSATQPLSDAPRRDTRVDAYVRIPTAPSLLALKGCRPSEYATIFRRFAEAHAGRVPPADFEREVKSLGELVRNPTRAHAIALRVDETPIRAGSSGDVVVVWLDPTCPVCDDASTTVLSFAEISGANAPHIYYRVMPSQSTLSRYIAIVLAFVRIRKPEEYGTAIIELMAAKPPSTADVDSLVGSLIGISGPLRGAEGYADAERQVDSDIAAYPFDTPPPVIVFRNRKIERSNAGGIAFDPLRDGLHLLTVINLMRLQDECNDKLHP